MLQLIGGAYAMTIGYYKHIDVEYLSVMINKK